MVCVLPEEELRSQRSGVELCLHIAVCSESEPQLGRKGLHLLPDQDATQFYLKMAEIPIVIRGTYAFLLQNATGQYGDPHSAIQCQGDLKKCTEKSYHHQISIIYLGMNYDYLTSIVKVNVTSFQESKTEANTIFFTLTLEAKGNKWYIEKRFSEFDSLYNGLKPTYHSLPSLPKKSYLFKMTEKELDQRRLGLEDFLQKIVIRNDLMNSELVKQFLQLDKNASDVMVNPPILLVEHSIEGQTKGIRDYVFIEEKNLFYIVTADMSPVSRLNAKVTNTKLPWESEASTKFMEVGSVEAWSSDPNSSRFVKVWSKGYPQEAICISYDRTSSRILVGLDDGVIDFIVANEGGYDDIACVKVHQSRVMGLSYDSLSNVVYSASQDKILRVSHGSSLALIMGIPHKEQLLVLYKDQQNKRIFVGTKIGEVVVYDIAQAEKPKLLVTLRNNKGGAIRSILFDSQRNYLFTGSFDDGELNVFDMDKPGKEKLARLASTLMGKEKMRALAWSPKRVEIMSGTADGSITFWNAVEGKPIFVLQAFDNEITRLDFISERNMLISSSKGKTIKIWTPPKEWRDAATKAREDDATHNFVIAKNREHLTNILAKAQEDSDDDDLAGWHLD